MFRAFYEPQNDTSEEIFEDAQALEDLSPGAILVIKINEDGTSDIIVNNQVKPTLTIKDASV